jgi:signal transduction histidine kinase
MREIQGEPEMKDELRKSGIDVIGDVPWGTHFCHFYQTRQDLIDILVPYFKAGLENKEFCMWITAHPLTEEEAERAMRRAVPDFDRYRERRQIEIMPHTEWYLKGGAFDSRRVLDGWVEKLDDALRRGYSGLRLTGNTFWLEKSDWKDFLLYEEEVNNVIGKYRMMAVCTYSLDKCRATEIIDVVNTHQFALAKREGSWALIESTERKRAEEEIGKLNEELKTKVIQLEAANEELEAFSYSVSHDLRSPLRIISGFGRVLLEDHADRLDAEGRDSVARMIAASHRMGQLIDDLLNLSRMSRTPVDQGAVDLSGMAREIASRLQAVQPERKVEFVIAEGVTVQGDERLLRLVLENLMDNSWKFTGTRPEARIELGTTEHEGQLACFVKDNGVGFDMAYADKLGMPFQRLHSVSEFPGTGIGLATVRRIIRRHGGRFWIEGEAEKGATTYFTLS